IVHACRPFVRKLREHRRGGHILMTGSEHSLSSPRLLRSLPLHLYNMTKHAVLSLGESLRAELGPEGVGVSVLCPRPVASGLAAEGPGGLGGPTKPEVPAIGAAEARELAALTLPAARAAEIALRGLAAGAFVIPTHRIERDDVDARYRELAQGFELLD